MFKNALTKLLNIQYPIIQAPIGSATTPELVAAVSNAGGLGTLALSWKDATLSRELIRRTKDLTDQPFAVNLVLAFDQQERVEICLQEQVQVVSFSWGDCSPYLKTLQETGIKVAQTIGNSKEGVYYEQIGVDLLIAQGWEAGGHVWSKVATSILIPAVSNKVSIPVIAAGGIASGKGFLAALALGASGVSLGTRLLLAKEAKTHDLYKQLIIKANEDDTVYADRLFNKGWDYAAHRVIRNSTVKSWEAANFPDPGQRTNENEIVAHHENHEPITRYSDFFPLKGMTGDLEALALYAGQSAGLLSNEESAEDIIISMVKELEEEFVRIMTLMKSSA